jgi:hypothetical protein
VKSCFGDFGWVCVVVVSVSVISVVSTIGPFERDAEGVEEVGHRYIFELVEFFGEVG